MWAQASSAVSITVLPLLKGKVDIKPDGGAAGLHRSLVAGLHGSRPTTRDHGITGFSQSPSNFLGLPIKRIIRPDPAGAEN